MKEGVGEASLESKPSALFPFDEAQSMPACGSSISFFRPSSLFSSFFLPLLTFFFSLLFSLFLFLFSSSSSAMSTVGLIGLAVMGQNLALNVAEKGFPISVYNRSGDKTDACVSRAAKEGEIGDRSMGDCCLFAFLSYNGAAALRVSRAQFQSLHPSTATAVIPASPWDC